MWEAGNFSLINIYRYFFPFFRCVSFACLFFQVFLFFHVCHFFLVPDLFFGGGGRGQMPSPPRYLIKSELSNTNNFAWSSRAVIITKGKIHTTLHHSNRKTAETAVVQLNLVSISSSFTGISWIIASFPLYLIKQHWIRAYINNSNNGSGYRRN